MPRSDHIQLSVRSAFAHARAHELAKLTGMTATQVVEDALRGYVPPGSTAKPARLVRRGPILVKPAGGRTISFDDAEAALTSVREHDVEG